MTKKLLKLDDYYQAAKESFRRIWQNKSIWFWGIFISSGMYFSFSEKDKEEDRVLEGGFIEEFILNYWNWILISILVLLILGFIFWVISGIARFGIIKELDRKQNNKKYLLTFRGIWRVGREDFKKVLLLDLSILGVVLGVLFVDLIIFILFYFIKIDWLFIILLAILVLATLVIFILLALLQPIALIFLVLSNLTIKNSFIKSWNLIKINFKEFLKFILTMITISVIGGFVLSLVVFLGVSIPTFLLGISGEFSMSGQNIFIIGLVIILIGVVGLLVFAVEAFISLWKRDLLIWWVKMIKGVKSEKENKKEVIDKKEEAIQEEKIIAGAKA